MAAFADVLLSKLPPRLLSRGCTSDINVDTAAFAKFS